MKWSILFIPFAMLSVYVSAKEPSSHNLVLTSVNAFWAGVIFRGEFIKWLRGKEDDEEGA